MEVFVQVPLEKYFLTANSCTCEGKDGSKKYCAQCGQANVRKLTDTPRIQLDPDVWTVREDRWGDHVMCLVFLKLSCHEEVSWTTVYGKALHAQGQIRQLLRETFPVHMDGENGRLLLGVWLPQPSLKYMSRPIYCECSQNVRTKPFCAECGSNNQRQVTTHVMYDTHKVQLNFDQTLGSIAGWKVHEEGEHEVLVLCTNGWFDKEKVEVLEQTFQKLKQTFPAYLRPHTLVVP